MLRCSGFLLLAAALAACEPATGNDARAPLPTGPALDISEAPETAGPFVIRFNDDLFFVLIVSDRSAGLISVTRFPNPPGVPVPCGGAVALDSATVQLVFHANGAINQLLMDRSAPAAIYDRRSFNRALAAGGLCGALATQVPLATGEVSLVAHDNDTFFSGAHANAFGWSARGLLTEPGGARLDYFSEYHGVVSTDGEPIHVVSRIRVRPAK